MSRETTMDKTRLAAFADGELSPEEAAAVVMHLADHPADQAYVDDLMAANEALGRAFDAPIYEPVPQAIRAAIFQEADPVAGIIPFRRRPFALLGGGLALAASVALAVVMLPNLLATEAGGERLVLGPVAAGSALAERLDSLPSGTAEAVGPGREFMILATLPVDGGFCREIEVVDEAASRIDLGIACQRGDGWQIEVTVFEPLSATGTVDGFVTASGAEVQGLAPFLERLGAGEALSPEDEARAIAQGWTAP